MFTCATMIVDASQPTWVWVVLGWMMHSLSFLLVCFHCLKHRREATSALLWIFIAWSFPAIGPLCYVAVGVDRVTNKRLIKHASDQRLLQERKAREEEGVTLAYWRTIHDAIAGRPEGVLPGQLDRAMQSIVSGHPLLSGNRVDPLVTGDEAFPRMLSAIRRAKHHVHLQTFIIGNDVIGREVMALLAEKATSGVTVRLMYDRFGSSRAGLSGLFWKYRNIPNFNIAPWTQANILKRRFQINLRNHRKILVVDGRTAFFGGINLHDENRSDDGTDPIRDYHFEVSGPVVQELQYTFMQDWHFMTGESSASLLQDVYFPPVEPAGPALARLVNSGPASELEVFADIYFMAIVAAQQQVLVVTPYFVPTRDIVRALRSAALRGVNVQVVVPAKNNHLYAGLAGRALYEELMEAGVRIFQRQPPFMHAKALIVDGAFALVGSANLDVRSLKLNYETDLALYDEDFINRLKRIVLDDVAASEELDLHSWRARPALVQLAENVCSLMTPVL